ncbi:hypothetical protein [Rufibacter roseolus]|uniref:hypothetical protein n=1 Tax=Rufibacter roseolus TaxID=2817375 RepID=UPI001B30E183|nr:hypothetical protein [Rufibacter roseolus]
MNKEEQTWWGVFLVIPMIFGYNLADALAPDDKTEFLYAALFGGAGALMGAGIYYLMKDKSKGLKIASATGLFAVGILALYWAVSQPTDEEILNTDWVTQTIGEVQFDSPEKLTLRTSEIPASAKWFYKEMKLYSDGKNDRLTTFLDSKITVDTLAIADAYSNALESMLKKHSINPAKLKLKTFSSDEEEISAMFTFDLNGETVNGYGHMFKKGEVLESVWLMPVTKGFSKEYIEEFEAGIIPNY